MQSEGHIHTSTTDAGFLVAPPSPHQLIPQGFRFWLFQQTCDAIWLLEFFIYLVTQCRNTFKYIYLFSAYFLDQHLRCLAYFIQIGFVLSLNRLFSSFILHMLGL